MEEDEQPNEADFMEMQPHWHTELLKAWDSDVLEMLD